MKLDPSRATRNPGKMGRVDAIAALMESGEWQSTDGYPALAEHWGVSVGTIEQDAKEASRLLRRANTDDEVKEWADTHLSHLTDLARSDRDYSNARGAIRDRLDARGLLVSKQQVSVNLERVADPEILKAALVEVCATEEGRQMVLEKADEIRGRENT